MKYSSVIFDWDGTLGKTLLLWLEGYRSELEKQGFQYSDRVIVDDFFYNHAKTVEKYSHLDFDLFMQTVFEYVNNNVQILETYPGTHKELARLREKGITLTLVSSSPRKWVKQCLEKTGLTDFFSVIVSGDDVMRHKPHPEPFLNIIEMAKLNPSTTIILGDSDTDIIAAKAAGIDSCLFLPPENELFFNFAQLKESNPTYCVDSLKNFTDLIIEN